MTRRRRWSALLQLLTTGRRRARYGHHVGDERGASPELTQPGSAAPSPQSLNSRPFRSMNSTMQMEAAS
jgi:hypothetical protein